VKNQVTILLLTIHSLAYTDIVQVLKFPDLVRHYHYHHAHNKSIGFIDFFLMHYGSSNDGDHKDDKEDMKLPFKTIDFHLIGHAVVVPQFFSISKNCERIYSSFFCNHTSRIVSLIHSDALFRPPILS
jgi:hypothetical protein